jgi:hypothetical protein
LVSSVLVSAAGVILGIVGNVCSAPVPSIYWEIVPAPVITNVPDVVIVLGVTLNADGTVIPIEVTVPPPGVPEGQPLIYLESPA